MQSGVNDFNVNARGFNSSLNRRMLVLQDGRDLAIAFLGSQEWNGMTQPLEDLGKVEVVRGPGSALYGANAFSGVVNITTPTAREVVGTKVTLAGGELETFRGDLRHASVFAGDRLGFRINARIQPERHLQPDPHAGRWHVAPARVRRRHRRAGRAHPRGACRSRARPSTPSPATPSATAIRSRTRYGSGRLDYYLDNGSVLSVDGGASQVQNEIFVTGIGRVQVAKAIKPYARVAMAADRYNVFAYWNSRTSIDPQVSLQSGLNIEERSDIFHLEGQTNWNFLGERGRVVGGASVRNTRVNTSGTLMNPVNDDRSDNQGSVYGQVEYKLTPQLRVVGAARVDDGDLFDTQFSPKAAVVFSPNEDHSFRFSVNRAFQTPNYSEFFLQVPVATPDPRPAQLEGGIQAYYVALKHILPPQALAGLSITDDLPWNFSAHDPGAGAGQRRPQGREGDRLGVRLQGQPVQQGLRHRRFLPQQAQGLRHRPAARGESAPTLPSRSRDGVNVPAELAAIDQRIQDLQSQGALTPQQAAGLRAPIPQLLGGYALLSAGTQIQGANALATLPDGSRAVVLSYTNAGRVTERGVEIGLGYQFTPEIRGDVSFTGFDFTVDSQAVGDQLAAQHAEQEGQPLGELRRPAGRGRECDGEAGGRVPVGGGRVPGVRPVERVREPERGVPGEQLSPGPRHRDESVRREAVPALRRQRDRAAGAGGNHGHVLSARGRITVPESPEVIAGACHCACHVACCGRRSLPGLTRPPPASVASGPPPAARAGGSLGTGAYAAGSLSRRTPSGSDASWAAQRARISASAGCGGSSWPSGITGSSNPIAPAGTGSSASGQRVAREPRRPGRPGAPPAWPRPRSPCPGSA